MNFTAAVIAEFLKGSVEGNPEASVNDVSKIEDGLPGTLSFLANPKYEKYIYDTQSSIVIVNDDFQAVLVLIEPIRNEKNKQPISKISDYGRKKPGPSACGGLFRCYRWFSTQ